jgi:hypothetical protein
MGTFYQTVFPQEIVTEINQFGDDEDIIDKKKLVYKVC